MISRTSKQMFYLFANPFMRINSMIYRHFFSPNRNRISYVHLGPGQNNYIENWINVDANMFTGKCDVWINLENDLPFKNNSIDAFYSHHVIEHLSNIDKHFKEVYRCLKPGGVYRLGGPNGDSAIKKFIENDRKWFNNWPRNMKSIGGRFQNFIFCNGEHLTILTSSFLEEVLENIGFVNIKICKPVIETNYEEIFNQCLNYESETDPIFPHTLIIEVQKKY
jgi:SAM-dependent methyltransferase